MVRLNLVIRTLNFLLKIYIFEKKLNIYIIKYTFIKLPNLPLYKITTSPVGLRPQVKPSPSVTYQSPPSLVASKSPTTFNNARPISPGNTN